MLFAHFSQAGHAAGDASPGRQLPAHRQPASAPTGTPGAPGVTHSYWDLGVTPCGARLDIRQGEKVAVRLPKILVLTMPSPLVTERMHARVRRGATRKAPFPRDSLVVRSKPRVPRLLCGRRHLFPHPSDDSRSASRLRWRGHFSTAVTTPAFRGRHRRALATLQAG